MSFPQKAEADSPPLISVVVPVYNEEIALATDLHSIFKAMNCCGKPYEVIVVDDGSTDHSLEIVTQQFPAVRLIKHPYNRGTGAARTTGLLAARGEIVVMTDADGTYPNQDMPKLIEALQDCDMVVGARVREAGTLRWLRTPAKTLIRWLASYLTGTKIPDLNSGFRAVKREVGLRYLNILPRTHSWVSTITIALLSDGYIVRYIPIEYYPRKGRSSFHPLRDTYNYLSLVVRSIVYFEPLKIFLPASLFLLVIGSIKFIRDVFFYGGDFFYIPGSTIVLLMMGIQLAAIGLLADVIVRRTKP
jgi:glycosyltransferase involved in cell wall biosynthesis